MRSQAGRGSPGHTLPATTLQRSGRSAATSLEPKWRNVPMSTSGATCCARSCSTMCTSRKTRSQNRHSGRLRTCSSSSDDPYSPATNFAQPAPAGRSRSGTFSSASSSKATAIEGLFSDMAPERSAAPEQKAESALSHWRYVYSNFFPISDLATRNFWQTLRGPFSAVSKPIFASKY